MNEELERIGKNLEGSSDGLIRPKGVRKAIRGKKKVRRQTHYSNDILSHLYNRILETKICTVGEGY
jgi:hypothetical protein